MSDTVSADVVSKHLKTSFTETKLVGSDSSVGAEQTDPNLINPWGISESATSPFWISDNGTGLASIYAVTPSGATINAIPPVTIAPPAGQSGPPPRMGRSSMRSPPKAPSSCRTDHRRTSSSPPRMARSRAGIRAPGRHPC